MAVLEGLEPKSVWTFFEELCGIPHGSGNLREISDHLVSFAKERNLEVMQDEALNVIIKKPGTAGYEDKEPVILQGHMDMVAVATPESGIDMKVTPLQLVIDGEKLRAKDTSLGGDDGIAVAMCMAILDAKDLQHPPLEVVITTEEETGMDGARALDGALLSGKRFINLDSEDEGVFMAGCAGGARFHACYMYEKVKRSGMKLQLTVSGLKGGHSGVMIHEERGNANVLLARVLYALYRKKGQDISLCSLNGGVADNAIPANATAVIVLPSDKPLAQLEAALKSVEEEIAQELATRDPGFALMLTELGRGTFESFDASSMKHAVKLILSLPNGVQAMSPDVKGLVETSLNLGMLQTDEASQTLQLSYAVRSSVESAKNHLNDRLRMIAKSFGAVTSLQGSYPGWQYAKESPLRDLCVRVFERMYGKTPVVEAIHAGVECGFFADKIPGLDCISLGPDMEEIHSTGEALSIPSTKRVYEFLCEVLKEL